MRGSSAILGDSHNFGRRVLLRGQRVQKPRSVFWEWLMLSADSPLRRLLDQAAERDGLGRDAFRFLPSLKFYPSRRGVGGEVERVSLEPLGRASQASRRTLAVIVGRSLALWSWLGVADLHWENLVLGRDVQGQVVFGPLDVELFFADLSLPTATKLLPDADPEYRELCRHACGVRRVLPYLGKPLDVGDLLAMAGAYRGTLALLERHASAIAKLLSGVPGLRQAPIRVLLRSTSEYVSPHREQLWPPLLDAEAEQLERGDVPYFFRLYGKRGIHYYADRALSRFKTLPLAGDTPQLEPLLGLSRGLRAPSRKQLREDGLFTLLGAFDDAAFSGKHASDGLTVRFGVRSLALQLPDGSELRAGRDLSAFVGSVYLPCRCGEVRSVLVPSATRCSAR
jgi:hypothetical protein